MLILNFLRYLRGTITFRIFGSFPQRIINACRNNNIILWDIVPDNNSYYAKTYPNNYKKIRKLRRKNKAKLRIVKKRGLPFKINRIKKRYGFWAGVFCSIILITFLTSRIWIIEIKCNEIIDSQEIINNLSSIGIRQGMKNKDINAKAYQKKLMLINDKIAWDAINIKGCKAEIEISIKQLPPSDVIPKNRYADIVAERDGQILYMEVKNGQKLCQIGQTINKGDVIVSGTMKDGHENIRCVYSEAIIEAVCETEIKVAVPFEKKVIAPSGKEFIKHSLFCDNNKYNLSILKNNDENIKISESWFAVPLLDNVRIKKETFQPIKYAPLTLSEEDAKKEAEKLLAAEKKKLNIIDVLYADSDYSFDENYYYITEALKFKKNIAKVREF